MDTLNPIAAAEWQRRRGDLNHQWLKNRLFPALDTADHVIRGRLNGTAYLQELVELDLPAWDERRQEIETLWRDFGVAMSPARMFELPPLSHIEHGCRALCADLLHELWLARCPVRIWLDELGSAFREADDGYRELAGVPPLDDAGEVRADFAARFGQFRCACRRLSAAIEALPCGVLIV